MQRTRIEFQGTGIQALGWGLLYILSAIFFIPLAWGLAALFRWIIRELSFSDGRRAEFEGRGIELFWYFIIYIVVAILLSVFGYFVPSLSIVFQLLLFPIGLYLDFIILQWLINNVRMNDDQYLEFNGEILPFIGWLLLSIISIITIIGWAWVYAAFIRWIAKKTNVGLDYFEFNGSGLEILWRCIVVGIASMFIIPIPWVTVWYIKWLVSETSLISEEEILSNQGLTQQKPVEDGDLAE